MTTTTPPPPYGYDYSPLPEPTPPPAAAAPVRTGVRRRTAALLLVGALGAGAVGAGITLAADGRAGGTGGGGGGAAATVVSTSSGGSGAVGTAQSAAAIIGPSVVTIKEQGLQNGQQIAGTGSGIVMSKDGLIVTNNHVVAAAAAGGQATVTFRDGTTVPATIVGTDPTSDLAVVKVNAPGKLVPATFDTGALVVGQSVLAVGAPLGLSNTVTEGIVSTIGRAVRTGDSANSQSVIDAIQTDAAINPGNSGGALVDLAGKVVGMNSAIATSGGSTGNVGVGFAIPATDVTRVAAQIVKTGHATHPLLGVSVGNTPNGTGAAVQQVSGAAQTAGLQAGDVITSVDGRAVTDADTLIVAVRDHAAGDKVTLTYQRNGQTKTGTAILQAAPTN